MIWLTWRQFRVPALAGAAVLGVLAAYLVRLGVEIRDARDGYLARCGAVGDCAGAAARFAGDHQNTLLILAGVFWLLPVVLGMFWGAPLVAREFEQGTHRLVWNQSVTRRRWLAVKLLVVAVAAMTVAGLASLLLTWAASPVDRVADDRFSTIVFGARDVAPVSYAVFAVVLGATVGLLVRRTVPAMAFTVVAVAAIQVAVPNVVRPQLMPPVTVSRPMTADAVNELRGLGSITGRPAVRGLTVPDAWVTGTSELLTADGRPLDAATFDDCLTRPPRVGARGLFGDTAPCLGALDLHVDVTYQPRHRYRAFQWLESALYLAAAGLLAGAGMWRIRRRVN
ncbi:ABC transporter permease subunit [Micromonospora sp. CPCC 205711]|uniref:ABC transporter permease subunit n=1 Tax=Micromonospora sp. CPCC 205547 TaxID=3122400 RepID=UPI002FEEE3F4